MFKFRLIAAVLVFTSSSVIPAYLSAQSSTDTELLDSIDTATLDYYLDTADRQKIEQRWFDYARFGVSAVTSAWEKDVLLMMGDNFELNDLKIEAEERLKDIVDERFAEWFNRKFFNSFSEISTGELNTEIEKLNNQYLFDSNPDGSIKYKTTENYDEEKKLWAQGVKAKISELLESWSERMITTYADLRSAFTEEGLRNKIRSACEHSFESYKNAYNNRLYRLYQIEQSRFSRLRLYDQYSLQHESESETAVYITNELIEQTQACLNTKLDTLTAGLETAVGVVRTDGGIIAADDWRSSFSSLLEQGMKNWDDAEQQLLMERVQWEQRSGCEVADGENVWAEAFMTLREKRTDWMTDFRETLEEGNTLWAEESLALDEAIEKSIDEINKNIDNTGASLQGRIDNLTGMILQSVNMMRTARNSWEYWMDRFDGGEKDSFDSRGTEFDADSMMETSSVSRPDIIAEERNDNTSYQEALYWISMFDTYQEYARDSQTRLAEAYGIVVFDDPSLYTAFDNGHLTSALLDKTLLEDDGAWEAVYLDEFQVELLKARAYMQYWEKQKETAQAVYDYALDNSSTKENADLTAGNLQSAKLDYDKALEEYSLLIDRLSVLNNDIESCNTDMEAIQQEIRSFQSQLSDARDSYRMIMTDLSVDNPQYLAEQYRENYVKLLELFGINDSADSGPGAALEDYLLAASEYELEQKISLVSRQVIDLVSGGDSFDLDDSIFNPDTASLYELKTRYENITSADIAAAAASGENIFTEFLTNELMLSSSDYRYELMLEFYGNYNSAEVSNRDEIIYDMRSLLERLQAEYEIQYESRLAAIKLYSMESFEQWGMIYFEAGDYNEITSISLPDPLGELKEAVAKDISVYSKILDIYENSEADENFIISDWSSCSPESAMQKIWNYLSEGNSDDEATAAEITGLKESLQSLLDWLDGFGSIEDGVSEFEQAVIMPESSLGQNYLGAYLDGYHNLSAGKSGDMYERIFADEILASAMKTSLLKILETSSDAPSLNQIRYEDARSSLISMLVDEGMLNMTDKTFLNPEAVWESKAFAKLSDVTGWFLQLDLKASELDLPSSIGVIFADYLNELKNYASIRSAEAFNAAIPVDILSINTEIRASSEQINELNSLLNKLQGFDDDTVKLLSIAETGELSEMRAEAERRLYETAGIDLAENAFGLDEFMNTTENWTDLFNIYCSSEFSDLSKYESILPYRDGIIERAEELYTLAAALADYENHNWNNEGDSETLSFYWAMLYNSLPFDSAESFITGPDGIDSSKIESLYIIDNLLAVSEGEHPEDPELEWIYKGNSVLRDADTDIKAGIPELWASGGLDLYSEVCCRYFTEFQFRELTEALSSDNEDSSAAVSVKQKAVQLWNRDYKSFAGSDLKSTLTAFTALVQINKSMVDAGEYTSEYGYDELLAELSSDLLLDEQDLKLFRSAADDYSTAISEKLDSAAASEFGALSGEELYWSLMISARDAALLDDYNTDTVRNVLIFDGQIETAGIVSYWLNVFGNDYDALRTEVDVSIERISQPLQYFLESSGIYADIFSFNLASILVSETGADAGSAVDFALRGAGLLGIETKIDINKFENYRSVSSDKKLDYLLSLNKDAALYQLKKELITGELTFDNLSNRFDDLIIPETEDRFELEQLGRDLFILKTYKPVLHGDFSSYVKDQCSDDVRIRRLNEIHYRYMGNPDASWDDAVFAGVFSDELNPSEILTRIESVRTRSDNTVSSNSIFVNEALSALNENIYGEDDSLVKQISALLARRELVERAEPYLTACSTDGQDNWRSFLTAEYLKDEEGNELVPLNDSSSDEYDYDRDLHLFSGTGDDLSNIIFDAACSYLDQTAYLTKAVESWTAEKFVFNDELLALTAAIDDYSMEKSYGELEDLYFYKPDAVIENNYLDKSSLFYSIQSGILSIKKELGSLGHRRETLISLSGMGDEEQVAVLKPIIDDIAKLENMISDADSDWQSLMDEPEGYRQLEIEYAEVYQQTKAALNTLNAADYDYSTARAVYEYATSGYLDIDDETFAVYETTAENTPDEGELEYPAERQEVDAGITGGSIVASDIVVSGLTSGQLYRNGLIDKINKVSPSEHLTYINGRLLRATAAYDAISSIIDSSIEKYSTYETDEAYRELFDGYIKTFRESLVLNKINYVLNQSIARQEKVTRDALSDWNLALNDSYCTINYLDNDDNSKVNENLSDLYLAKNDAGGYRLEWNTNLNSKTADFEDYLSPVEGSEDGHSAFENDLGIWLKKINAMGSGDVAQQQFTLWAMAIKYEEYSSMSIERIDEVTDDFWRTYLYKNGERDLDREKARTILINEWTAAYKEVEGSSDEQRWMFDFYKLLEKSGSMNISSSDDENLQFLAEKESIVITNEYMAEKYHQGASKLVKASIPVFAMAAMYYVAATSVLAVPFGWIAAAILFSVAAGLTYGGVQLAGEGAMKHAAAKQIEKEVVGKADKNIRSFMSGFSRDTAGILERENLYKLEYDKLLTMRGEQLDGKELSDSERITMLQNAAIQAFETEEEDLHGLLVQAGLADVEGSVSDDKSVLAVLFGYYQEQMSVSAKEQSSDSNRFISSLESESQKIKQTMARELNNYLTASDGIARRQSETEINYERAYYAYIKEEESLEDFETAAAAAWQAPLFSTREHLLRLYEQQNEIAEMIMGSDRFNVDISTDLLDSQKILLCGDEKRKGIYDYKMDNYLESKQYEMDMLRLEMAERRKQWESQMSAITARGELEWSAGARRFNREYETWLEKTKRTYLNQKNLWDDKYLDFLSDKDQWIDAVTIQSTRIGDMKIFENFGDMTRCAIAAAGTNIIVSDLNTVNNPDEILDKVIDFELLGTLIDSAENLTAAVDSTKPIIFSLSAPDKFTNADSLQSIKDFQSLQNEKSSRHIAALEYNRLIEQVHDAEENFIEIIDNSNEGVDKSINETMSEDGYTRNGNRYQRNLVTGATVAEYIYETGYVSTYSFYCPENTDFSSELKDYEPEIKNMDAKGLQGMVARALYNIENKLEKIFGKEGEKKLEIVNGECTAEKTEGLIESFINFVSDDEDLEPGTRIMEQSPGLFGQHIGYAPEFQNTADPEKEWNAEGQIKYNGAGQMGIIFGEYLFNKIKEGTGWAEVNMPHYRKKLWDSEYAPSTADLTGLTVSVLTLGAGTGLNILASAAINLTDDLALSVMDIGTDERTLAEGAFDFAKTAGVSMLNSFLGGVIKDAGISSLSYGEQIGIGAAQQLYNNTTSSAINALSFDSGIGWEYNLSVLDQGIFGAESIAGIAGGAVNMLAGSYLGDIVKESWTPVEQAFYGGALTLGGIAADQAAEYTVNAGYQLAQDGLGNIGGSMKVAFDNMGMSLNLLDIGSIMNLTGLLAATMTNDFNDNFMADWNTAAQNLNGTGLFALNINSSGVHGQITNGGKNIGSCLYDLGKGFTIDMATRNYNKEHADPGADLLRNGYAFGDQSFENTIWRLLAGHDSMTFDLSGSKQAETIYSGGSREIHMNTRYSYADNEDMLKAAAVLQHESHRDGLDSLLNDEETYRAVKAHTEMVIALGRAYGFNYMAGDENLLGDVAAYMASMGGAVSNVEYFREYAGDNYDSSADYWKLMDTGEIVWDGERDLRNEAGEIIRIDKTGSFSKSLLNWFGDDNAKQFLTERGMNTDNLTEAEIAYQLMKSSGVEWDYNAVNPKTGKTGAYVPTNQEFNIGSTLISMDEMLRFQLTESEAFHLGKISQESPDIAYYADQNGEMVNVMANSGCFYLSTLGAVQTMANELLTSNQIKNITETGLSKGWLSIILDEEGSPSINTMGNVARRNLSQLAFLELGQFGYLDYMKESEDADGSLMVGDTSYGNYHAREGNSVLAEIYDPYEAISYASGGFLNIRKSQYYNYFETDYKYYYWSMYGEYYK